MVLINGRHGYSQGYGTMYPLDHQLNNRIIKNNTSHKIDMTTWVIPHNAYVNIIN